MADPILVEVECIRATAADSEYFEEGRIYTVDMVWAKKRDIWRYFKPLREVPMKEANDRIHDQMIPDQLKAEQARDEANEEAEAKLREKNTDPIKSYAGGNTAAKARPKAKVAAAAKAAGKK